MRCAWTYTADRSALPWPCGAEPLCPRLAAGGRVDVGLVVEDGADVVIRRDGDEVAGLRRTLGPARDGCDREGQVIVVGDHPPFGWHRYTVEQAGTGVATDILAPGPGADDPTPGLVLGLVVWVAGAALARVPAAWGW